MLKWSKQCFAGAACLFLIPASNALAQSFDFKGVVLGSRVDIKRLEQEHHLTCNAVGGWVRGCTGKTTFLGMEGNETVLLDKQGVVTEIQVNYMTTTIWPKTIAAELSKKFGPPKYQRQDMIFTWVNSKNEMLHLEHRSLTMKVPRVASNEVSPSLKNKDF